MSLFTVKMEAECPSETSRKQLCMDMTVITQLYCQLHITCQLRVSANTVFGHHQVGYNYRRKLHKYTIRYSIAISVGVSGGGRDLVYKRVGGCVCRRFNMYICTCHVTSMIS